MGHWLDAQCDSGAHGLDPVEGKISLAVYIRCSSTLAKNLTGI